ncbi:unnamed protein product [Cylindrotheca closterium]|uniref:Helicase-associated domain-containing protein n=1 Tax=Cylindrotheca closterium TaxID=2856 RepID=A0AAD2JI00_9STRA|nr:unnamed protein product [Cylindrotheca closterium]
MLGIRPRQVQNSVEDFSIFDHNNGDAFEPIPIDRPRTEQQTAAIRRVFRDAIHLLFHSENPTVIQQVQETQPRTPLSSTTTRDTIAIETSGSDNLLEGRRLSEVTGLDSSAAIDSGIPANQAIQCMDDVDDHRVSRAAPRDEYSQLRFRPYQNERWEQCFSDLLKYRQQYGHCCVPHTYDRNPALARWVKRQRYQFKLRSQGKESTMTIRRVQALEEAGFIWDSHNATWEERLNELKEYRRINGHCEVPTHYQQNKKLATWVKCQRRQYKLYRDGRQSTMTPERIDELDQMDFSWGMRGPKGTDK